MESKAGGSHDDEAAAAGAVTKAAALQFAGADTGGNVAAGAADCGGFGSLAEVSVLAFKELVEQAVSEPLQVCVEELRSIHSRSFARIDEVLRRLAPQPSPSNSFVSSDRGPYDSQRDPPSKASAEPVRDFMRRRNKRGAIKTAPASSDVFAEIKQPAEVSGTPRFLHAGQGSCRPIVIEAPRPILGVCATSASRHPEGAGLGVDSHGSSSSSQAGPSQVNSLPAPVELEPARKAGTSVLQVVPGFASRRGSSASRQSLPRSSAASSQPYFQQFRRTSVTSSAYGASTGPRAKPDIYKLDAMRIDTMLGIAPLTSSLHQSEMDEAMEEEEEDEEEDNETLGSWNDTEERHMDPALKGDHDVAFIEARRNRLSDAGILNMEQLREKREKVLLNRSGSQKLCSLQSAESLEKEVWTSRVILQNIPRTVMCIYGILPFRTGRASLFYMVGVALLQVLILVRGVILTMAEPSFMYMHLTNACYAVGGMLSVAVLRRKCIQDLVGPDNHPLEAYAEYQGFLLDWIDVSFHRFIEMLTVWAFLVIAAVALPFAPGADVCIQAETSQFTMHMIFFIVSTGHFAALNYCLLHVCCGLELMIDCFCVKFFENPKIAQGVCEWNMLQAILRRAATTVDSAFLTLQTSALAIVLLTCTELMFMEENVGVMCAPLRGLSGFPVAIMSLYSMFRAAAVSERCSRVPALVNSLSDDNPIDSERQFLVQYVSQSAAGFYVKGVRLTSTVVLKLTYLGLVLVFTLVTRVILKWG